MSVRWVLSFCEVLEKRDLPRSAHEKVPMICNLRGKDDGGGGGGSDCGETWRQNCKGEEMTR